ncbi:MAG TPA: ATP-binding protein [Bryobacteraceae bacterium]
MTERHLAHCAIDKPVAVPENGRPNTLRQSVGLVDRICTDEEMLQYLLEVESSRQDLQRSTLHLNQLVDESAKAMREIELASQAKGDFLAMMSHEMRTPLNGIIGMTAVLRSRSIAEEDRDCVETIRQSGEALLAIIDDVLDFSKIEAGRLQLENADFKIASAIEEALQIVRGTAALKPLTLATFIDPAIPSTVSGDFNRLRQILLNFLSNAIKFTAEGEIAVRAELRDRLRDGYELYFSVSDQGIGITPEQQARLFQPFSQAEASTTRKFGGTGLGLVICKRLAELMGGSIGVTSSYGHGSSFWFTIKVRATAGAALPSTRSACLLPRPCPARNSRLLLVEDNTINQKVALLMLEKLGHQVDVAANGYEALSAMAGAHYDVVLMDCMMPEMDGFEATRRLRSLGGYAAEVPVIAMTASAFAEDRLACLAAGMTDFLSKPVRESELGSKLDHWLSPTTHLPAQS